MYGVDVILSGDNEPMVLEVQWAPDCAQAVIQNKNFWNEILGGLYLEEFMKFRQI
jgi:glutathione synthase/RimK-type ligase-like ATP-grasp enzyme